MKVLLYDDCDVVNAGMSTLLSQFPAWVLPVRCHPRDADIVLFDWRLGGEARTKELLDLVALKGPKVAIFTWDLSPALIVESRSAGVAGYLSKGMSGPELVDALVRISRGERLVANLAPAEAEGKSAYQGLTPREAEVLERISRGMTNVQIAEELYLSMNTVKSYIRSCYRKVGVTRRSQAIVLALGTGAQTADAAARAAVLPAQVATAS